MKRILISGWYGFGNIGDEAILAALVSRARKEYPAANISVLSYYPVRTSAEHGISAFTQLPVSGYRSWVKFLITMRFLTTFWLFFRCDLFWLGGGGFLSDFQPEVPKGWLRQIKLAKLFGAKTVLKQIGAGPFMTEAGKKTTFHYISKYADDVIVRDEISKSCLVSTGLASNKIKVEIDPVANMDLDMELTVKEEFQGKIGIIYTDFFNPRYWKNHSSSRITLLQCYKEQIQTILDLNEKPILLLFQPKNPLEVDLRDLLMKEFSSQGLEAISIQDYRHGFEVINSLKGVISFRLHGNIIAYRLKKPFLPISYHHKTDGFLQMIDFLDKNDVLRITDGMNLIGISSPTQDWRKKTERFVASLKVTENSGSC